MKIRISPSTKNTFPLRGILIKGNDVKHWIKEIQRIGFNLSEITVYPVPDTTPNSIWGCLIEYNDGKKSIEAGQHLFCQLVHDKLFIPEKAMLHPALLPEETEKLFASGKHILHPEFGLVELTETVNWQNLIFPPVLIDTEVTRPEDSVFIPKTIKSFQVKPVPPEEIISQMEKSFSMNAEEDRKPLNLLEKAKHLFYKQLFGNNNNNSTAGSEEDKRGGDWGAQAPASGFWNSITGFLQKILGTNSKWVNNMRQDFDNLEERNQKQIDKLMDLLKKNPKEGLKYAMPLDAAGTSRGESSENFLLSLMKRWSEFSLFGNNSMGGYSGAGGSPVLPANQFNQLQAQYYATAQELINKKEYMEAAFIYMKLLKNYNQAAQTLETGMLYQEAASVYLKYSHNKQKAAECYEKGNMTLNAIELHKELNNNEKVGDLYISLKRKQDAYEYYEKVVETYKSSQQYLKASLLYRNKMENPTGGQTMLMEGWRSNKDAFNCLNNYFNNIEDTDKLGEEIETVYKNEVSDENRESFLNVMKYEYDKQNKHAGFIKDIAYEIVVTQTAKNPAIVSELHFFNAKDKELIKDTVRFKLKNRK